MIKIILIFISVSFFCNFSSPSLSLEKNNFNLNKFLISMTLEEKVGQLFIIRPDSLNTERSLEDIHDSKKSGDAFLNNLMIENLKKYPAGGFVIFRKNFLSVSDSNSKEILKLKKSAMLPTLKEKIGSQALPSRFLKKFISDLKSNSKIKPFIAVDEEGGKISRIANSKFFDKKIKAKLKTAQEIGNSKNPENAFKIAVIIADYLKEYGFNFDFAPVADVNTNPENIVIGDRAFGSDPEIVSKMSSRFIDGLNSKGILSSLKHFPGHGDTKEDTHSGYVEVQKTWEDLKKCELIPFIENLNKASSIMTAHITLKNITSDNLPATLSKELITGKLREELGYDGLVITDAFNMGAIKDNYSSSEAAILAIEAGNDIILMPYDYISAFNGILEAVKTGRISEERLNQSVLRILKIKLRKGF